MTRVSPAVRARAEALTHAGHLDPAAPGFATGHAADLDHGARVRVQLVVDAQGLVVAAKFLAFGCPSVIASASWVVEQALDRPRAPPADELAARVVEALALDPARHYAAALAVRALAAAVDASVAPAAPST